MDFNHQLRSELKRLRIEAGLTQSQLAVKANKDTDYISKIERGERRPTVETLVDIANALNLKPSEILSRIGF